MIRWVLTYAKVPFEDTRIPKEEWPAYKPNSPTGQLPMIECTDKKTGKTMKMVQGFAIVRSIACWNKLSGKTPCEHGACDEVIECLRDVIEPMGQARFEQDEARKAQMMEKNKTETIPRIFGCLEKRLAENGGKFLVGDAYTYADIVFACFIDSAKLMMPAEAFEGLSKAFPKLIALAKDVAETPEIKSWIAKRPESQF